MNEIETPEALPGQTTYRVYRYRLYPDLSQAERLWGTIEAVRHLYNAALEERKEAFEAERRRAAEEGREIDNKKGRVSARAQKNGPQSLLAREKEAGELPQRMPASVAEDAIDRVQWAYQGFFRRVREGGDAPGYPKFKREGTVRSAAVKRSREFRLEHRGEVIAGSYLPKTEAQKGRPGRRHAHLTIKGFGELKLRYHRGLPEGGVVKSVLLKKERSGEWHALFRVEVPAPPPAVGRPDPPREVGLHPALINYLSTDSGEIFKPYRAFFAHKKALADAQRSRSKKVAGSVRYRRESHRIAQIHRRIAETREHFHHNLAAELARRYDVIYFPAYDIRKMVEEDDGEEMPGWLRRRLNLMVKDAAWAQFASILKDKLEAGGGIFVAVPSPELVQECSRCSEIVNKGPFERTHRCHNCGLISPRGVNAAANAKTRGREILAAEKETG